jgi:hypothetical protein
MAVLNLNKSPVVPSDVFGWEVNTDVGYGRESFTITTAALIGVGEVLVADYAAKTAVRVGALADADDVDALGDLVIFVGRDLTNNPATAQDFDRLTLAATGVGVAITRGDGRGTLYKKHLMFGGVAFYDLPAVVQAALVAKFTTENRFKVLDQV